MREYRLANEDRIIRELTDFLSIPNIATDTPNIQKNAAQLSKMLQARGIETHLLPIKGRGPVVFGSLSSPAAKHTVIFYAHYDGQPVDPAAWTDGKPFEPILLDGRQLLPYRERSRASTPSGGLLKLRIHVNHATVTTTFPTCVFDSRYL